MRRGLTLLALLVGVVLLVALFLLLRPEADGEEPLPARQATATSESPTVEEEPTTTTEPEPEVPTLRVAVLEGRPRGGIQRLTVRRGDRVRIVVRTDVSDHVHVHGYDLMRNAGPGRPARFAFMATIPGRFEIELEDRGLPIGELEVRP